jgi:hypothetical protein
MAGISHSTTGHGTVRTIATGIIAITTGGITTAATGGDGACLPKMDTGFGIKTCVK